MQDIKALFADYAAYHQTAGNKFFHRLGIPMIMLSLIGMLTQVPLIDIATVKIDLAMILIAAAAAYYFVIEWRLAIAMIAISIAFLLSGCVGPKSSDTGMPNPIASALTVDKHGSRCPSSTPPM